LRQTDAFLLAIFSVVLVYLYIPHLNLLDFELKVLLGSLGSGSGSCWLCFETIVYAGTDHFPVLVGEITVLLRIVCRPVEIALEFDVVR
jgi:hypothetical protein